MPDLHGVVVQLLEEDRGREVRQPLELAPPSRARAGPASGGRGGREDGGARGELAAEAATPGDLISHRHCNIQIK